MFTSDGYQPSIFMDTSPRHTCPDRRRDRHYDQVPNADTREETGTRRVDYIQIWLNTHPPEVVQGAGSGTTIGTTPSTLNVPQETSAPVHDSEIEPSQDGSMEWQSCVSSFGPTTAAPAPESNQQARSCSPGPSIQTSNHPAVLPCKLPSSFAFQKHMMLPILPFQGRARCIFLASESSTDARMHRSVAGLLHNAAVQRIRHWLKTTIEGCALEQWRNLSLLTHLTELAAAATITERPASGSENDKADSNGNSDCPICFKPGMIMKVIVACGHAICWKCELHLNQTGNISCPMCRRIRLASSYKNVRDLFRTTIGLHPDDYTHPYCQPAASETPMTFCFSEEEEDDEVEHELADRYMWEPSASFLGYLQYSRYHPAKQYFQLNAVHDLCSKPSTEQHLPEYSDQSILEPPLSGLVLPPHRLYIALIHFCLDMLTLPSPTEFQRRPQFKRETMLLDLVILFLVPTDEFSPRNMDRIYNAPAWVEQGQYILARIHRFIQTKMRQSMAEMNSTNDDAESPDTTQQQAPATVNQSSTSVPSVPIPRHILYLGTARWMWIAQSLTALLTWIHAADLNPSMVGSTSGGASRATLGKHSLRRDGDTPPAKRRCPNSSDIGSNDV
ncbi:hypothetical protein B0O80DRAFT_499581 [Mortierella sp. GBAus27b]|nr:hypothetical protein B0O80DRAFT_499581 [Mortierella sp. GBAus27b]